MTRWQVAAGAALALLLAFGAGYETAANAVPAKVEVHERVEVREDTARVLELEERVRKLTAETIEARRVSVRTVHTVEVRPDGTRREITDNRATAAEASKSSSTDTAAGTKAASSESSTRTASSARASSSTSERPAWRVSALVGASLGGVQLVAPVYGAAVSRRVAGPLSAGAFGLGSSAGAVGGLSVSLEF